MNKYEFKDVSEEYKKLSKMIRWIYFGYGALMGMLIMGIYFVIVRIATLFISWWMIK